MPRSEKINEKTFKYTIDTELSTGNRGFFPEYLRRQYLLQHEKYRTFKDVRVIAENEENRLFYRVQTPPGDNYVAVTVYPRVPIEVTMELSGPDIPDAFLDQLYEDLFLRVQLFEEEIRKTTVYIAFMPEEKMIPEKEKTGLLARIFTDSMLPLYIALMGARGAQT